MILSILVVYTALSLMMLARTQDVEALSSAAVTCALVPVGLLLAIMKADVYAALGLGLLIALAATFAIRMPGIVRVPLLVAIFAGGYFVTLQAGLVLT